MNRKDWILSIKLTLYTLLFLSIFWGIFSFMVYGYSPDGAPLDLKNHSRINSILYVQPGTGTSGGSDTARARIFFGTQSCVGVGNIGYISPNSTTGLPFLDYLYSNGSSTIGFKGFGAVVIEDTNIVRSESDGTISNNWLKDSVTKLGQTIELGAETTGNTDNIPEGSTNLYYTNARVNNVISSTSIDALSDVDVGTATDGQFLKKVNGTWVGVNGNTEITNVINSTSIDALSDVDVGTATDGQFLKKVNGVWVGADSSTTVDWSAITGTPTTNSNISATSAANKIVYSTDGTLNNWLGTISLATQTTGIEIGRIPFGTTTGSLATDPALTWNSNTLTVGTTSDISAIYSINFNSLKLSDGVTWTQATGSAAFSGRYGHASVVYNNKMWVIGGIVSGNYLNDVWYSTDGVTWTQATGSAAFSGRYGHASVVYNNKMWVIGGNASGTYKKDVWYSTDGVTWTQATANAAFDGRMWHKSVVYNNKMWVIGGNASGIHKNDVWYSTDGVTWTQATGSAAFSARSELASIVYNDKMWVIGGNSSGTYKNDVWYSTDGVTWTQATGSAAFSERVWHASVVYNNKMWVIGGIVSGNYLNDVWYSTDGVTWTQATGSAAFSGRYGHASVVYNNKMWVIGGNASGTYKNDVWYSSEAYYNTVIFNETGLYATKIYSGTTTTVNNQFSHFINFNDNSTGCVVQSKAPQSLITTADTFVSFRDNTGAEIGSIAGTGVSGVIAYNTFTGAHACVIEGDRTNLRLLDPLEISGGGNLKEWTYNKKEIKEVEEDMLDSKGNPVIEEYGTGTITLTRVKKIKVMKEVTIPVTLNLPPKPQLVKLKRCTTRKSPNVVGLYAGTDSNGRDMYFGLGTAICRVINLGENIKLNDYLMTSDFAGYLERQPDIWLPGKNGKLESHRIPEDFSIVRASEEIIWEDGEQSREIACRIIGG